MAYSLTDLKESNEFLNTVLNNIDAGVFLLDEGLKLRNFNQAFALIFGIDDDNVLGEFCGNATKCAFAVEEKKECGKTSRCGECKLRSSVRHALKHGICTTHEKIEHEYYIHGKRMRKYLEFSTKRITLDNNNMALEIIRDITESETQKLEVLKSHELIARQNAELENAYKQLKSAYLKMERDHGIAQTVLARLSSKDYGRFPNIRVQSGPVETVGGDVFFMSDRPSGELHLLLGDFTGHGLTAALGAIPTSDIFLE